MQESAGSTAQGRTGRKDVKTTTAVSDDGYGIVDRINTGFQHPYLNAAAVILLFLLLGKIVDWLATGVFTRLVGRTKTKYDDRVLKILHRPIFLSVMLAGLGLATYLLGQPAKITAVTIHILQTIAVFVWFRFGLRLTRVTLDEMEKSEHRFGFITANTKPLLRNTISIILVAIGIYAAFLIWNINITAWVASAGIIGLAVSFAAKDTLANVFGGVTIFADKPFKVGDYINFSTGERGVITQIGVRSTRILTRDDIEIIVPNGILATTTIINESGGPHEKFRVRVKVGVAYGSDIDKVERVLLNVAESDEEVCKHPSPRARFRQFGASSLEYELLCWVERPVMRGLSLHKLNRSVYKAFERENIRIPFPQRDVHLYDETGSAADA